VIPERIIFVSRGITVSLIFGGNNLGDYVLHPDIIISLLYVDNE